MKIMTIVAIFTVYSSLRFTERAATNIDIIDGYRTITIAGITWMTENYKGNINAGSCYEDNLKNCMEMGRLYTYDAAVRSAPAGWHLPSKEEWDTLLSTLQKQGNAYEILSTGAFDARFAGFKDAYGDYTKLQYQARYWSATEWKNDEKNAWYMYLSKSRQIADVDTDEKKCLFSVRYVKNKQ